MTKLKRTMLISGSLIMLCMCAVVAITYTLFTDSVNVKNHLQAGALNVRLIRTDLEYAILDEEGNLTVHRPDTPLLDFTNGTEDNVFGIDSEDVLIVPGCYFDAKLAIQNSGNVPFDYAVSVQTFGEMSRLAEQLRVIVTDGEGKELGSAMLSELSHGMSIVAGHVEHYGEAQSFGVKVLFVDDRDYNRQPDLEEEDYIWNNAAQHDFAEFDIIVRATQAVK